MLTFVTLLVTIMNTRLKQFLAAENISQAQFADSINVVRASVSHVLSGRNNPSYDFIKAIMLAYPKLDMEWLIFGKGKMYKDQPASIQMPHEVEPTPEILPDLFSSKESFNQEAMERCETKTSANNIQQADKQRRIARVTILFTDGTYQELE